ncbi:unnamed protein product, partial [Pleuronectes platessa]
SWHRADTGKRAHRPPVEKRVDLQWSDSSGKLKHVKLQMRVGRFCPKRHPQQAEGNIRRASLPLLLGSGHSSILLYCLSCILLHHRLDIKMDATTGPQKVKPKRLNRHLVAGWRT